MFTFYLLKMEKSNLITLYIEGKSLSMVQKRTSSALSPGDSEQHPEKANINMDQDEEKTTGNTTNPSHGNSELKSLLGPLIDEVKLLREAVDVKDIKLENAIMTQKMEIKETLANKIDENDQKIQQVLEENVQLKKENMLLKERIDRIESAQLSNNVRIMRVPEQP